MLILGDVLLGAEVPLAVAQRGHGEEHDREDDGQEPGPDALGDDAADVVGNFGVEHRSIRLFHFHFHCCFSESRTKFS